MGTVLYGHCLLDTIWFWHSIICCIQCCLTALFAGYNVVLALCWMQCCLGTLFGYNVVLAPYLLDTMLVWSLLRAQCRVLSCQVQCWATISCRSTTDGAGVPCGNTESTLCETGMETPQAPRGHQIHGKSDAHEVKGGMKTESRDAWM